MIYEFVSGTTFYRTYRIGHDSKSCRKITQ